MKKSILLHSFVLFAFLNSSFIFANEVDINFFPKPNGRVYSIAMLANNQIMVAGDFTYIDGKLRRRVIRLNNDGSVDPNFNPNINVNAAVYSMAMQEDGKILIGGVFELVNGLPKKGFVRLNSDGTIDTSLSTPNFINSSYPSSPIILIRNIVVESGGKILVQGGFDLVNGLSRKGFVRLNVDGSVDTTFNPSFNPSGIGSIALQDDGKILVSGPFTQVNGESRANLVRLESDGSVDLEFTANTSKSFNSLVIQNGGWILAGNRFGLNTASDITRFNIDGSDNASFNVNDLITSVRNIVPQSNGKIFITGRFNFFDINGTLHRDFIRLNSNGTIDLDFIPIDPFNSGFDDIKTVVMQPDGKLLLGGSFDYFDGIYRRNFARITLSDSVPEVSPTEPSIPLEAKIKTLTPIGSLILDN